MGEGQRKRAYCIGPRGGAMGEGQVRKSKAQAQHQGRATAKTPKQASDIGRGKQDGIGRERPRGGPGGASTVQGEYGGETELY
jgi:hypothetical protein